MFYVVFISFYMVYSVLYMVLSSSYMHTGADLSLLEGFGSALEERIFLDR